MQECEASTKLGRAFEICKHHRRHLLVVVDKTVKMWPVIGILTTEDILEEILQDEIVGDDDQLIDDAAASQRRPGLARRNSKAYDPLTLLRQLTTRCPSKSDAAEMVKYRHQTGIHEELEDLEEGACLSPEASCTSFI